MNRETLAATRSAGAPLLGATLLLLGAFGLSGCTPASGPEREQASVQARLQNFDDLDFNVFTNQKWEELSRSHSRDILVHWPDGRVTRGIDDHISDLRWIFLWAPDTRIQEHPVKFGQSEWTAAISVMEGTFSKPMPTASGKIIPPTMRPYKISLCTLGHWKGATMDEEYLYWDNLELMKQIGLGKEGSP